MFTGRHGRELAEIKTLVRELDLGSREALEGIQRIAAAWELTGGEIRALAAAHGLPEIAADRLRALVRLVNWDQKNFVSRSPTEESGNARASSWFRAVNVLADSLAGLEFEALRSARRVADLGSGAGFPGLVLAIALPTAQFTLIERAHERCEFLRRAISELGMGNVEILEENMRALSAGHGPYDVVTARKVGRMERVLRLSAPVLARNGTVVLWPGTTDFTKDQLPAAAKAAGESGLRLAHTVRLRSASHLGEEVVKHVYAYERIDRGPKVGRGR